MMLLFALVLALIGLYRHAARPTAPAALLLPEMPAPVYHPRTAAARAIPQFGDAGFGASDLFGEGVRKAA